MQIFINLILIYCKIKEEAQGKEEEASEEVTSALADILDCLACTCNQ